MRIDSAGFNQPYGVRRLVAAVAATSGDKAPHSKQKRRTALISAAVNGQLDIPAELAKIEAHHED